MSQPPLIENLTAPELYAVEATAFATLAGVVTITFTAMRWDNSVDPPVGRRFVVGRVSMPVAGAQGLALGLYDYLKKSGLDPAALPEGEQRQ